jgi:hypothetical protein
VLVCVCVWLMCDWYVCVGGEFRDINIEFEKSFFLLVGICGWQEEAKPLSLGLHGIPI